ncbi:hypothetical protein DFH04_07375 [Clostridium novyi]|uniref:hypothetical protein n=1 Tax=Clostridium novyi TaxID=1542 RepID=UPI000EA2DD35|nr:hypothetical protein [Clostridium novyi]AYF54537.1 hypothetical protein DFH04_07375 [Clostridium novyi]
MSNNNWGGIRKGAGRIPLKFNEKKKGVKIYITDKLKLDILEYGNGKSLSEKAVELIEKELEKRK